MLVLGNVSTQKQISGKVEKETLSIVAYDRLIKIPALRCFTAGFVLMMITTLTFPEKTESISHSGCRPIYIYDINKHSHLNYR